MSDYLGKAHELDLATQKIAEVLEMLPDDAVSQVIRAKLQTAQGHINTVRGRQ